MELTGQQIFIFLSQYGYWIIFPLMFLEGPMATIMAAILASLGAFNIWVVLVLSIFGDVLGDIGLYGVGKKWGFGFVNKFGKYIGVTEKRVRKMEKYFNRHGGKTVFLAKSTTGLCFVAFISAGIAKMELRRFIKYSVLGGVVWSSFLVAMGYFYGYLWREIGQYIEWAGWAISSLALFSFIGIYLLRKYKIREIIESSNNFYEQKSTKKIRKILTANKHLLCKDEQDLINKSFYFKGSNGQAILLLHGWSTTPYEIRRLGKFLNERGYTVYGPMLKGHGATAEDLENVKYQDWLTDAENAYDKLRRKYDCVYVGGTSMGATLSICLAKKRRNIAGLILMATPYRLKFEKIGELAMKLLSKFKKYHKKFYPPTFGGATTVTRLISYQVYPIKNVLEVGELAKKARQNLNEISQPCLILQSAHDHIVAKNSADKIYEQISSKEKRKRYLKKAYHTFISDIRNEHVFDDILNFLKEN